MKPRAAELIEAAQPVAVAVARYVELRQWRTALSQTALEARAEIGRLTEQLRANVRAAAAVVA